MTHQQTDNETRTFLIPDKESIEFLLIFLLVDEELSRKLHPYHLSYLNLSQKSQIIKPYQKLDKKSKLHAYLKILQENYTSIDYNLLVAKDYFNLLPEMLNPCNYPPQEERPLSSQKANDPVALKEKKEIEEFKDKVVDLVIKIANHLKLNYPQLYEKSLYLPQSTVRMLDEKNYERYYFNTEFDYYGENVMSFAACLNEQNYLKLFEICRPIKECFTHPIALGRTSFHSIVSKDNDQVYNCALSFVDKEILNRQSGSLWYDGEHGGITILDHLRENKEHYVSRFCQLVDLGADPHLASTDTLTILSATFEDSKAKVEEILTLRPQIIEREIQIMQKYFIEGVPLPDFCYTRHGDKYYLHYLDYLKIIKDNLNLNESLKEIAQPQPDSMIDEKQKIKTRKI